MEQEDDQDIYDDGTSITNNSSVGRIKSMFEPAIQGPKPSLPSKPPVKPLMPKRSDDTKITSNGDVRLPPKHNITPTRNIVDVANRNTDENSIVKNGSDIKLKPELVSKFSNMKKITGSDTNVDSRPSWVKAGPTEISPKPVGRTAGKFPIEGFSNRLKKFENLPNGDNENTSGTPENHKPQILSNDIKHGIAESKAAIARKFIPKLPTKTDNNKAPTPIKPSPTEHKKPIPQIKPKPSASSSPVSRVNGSGGELFRAIQKPKESMINDGTSEKINEELKNRTRTKSLKRKSLTRVVDDKKFFVVEFNDLVVEDKPPTKPPKIPNIDVDKIVSEYKKKFSSPEEKEALLPQGCIEEDIYEELPEDDNADFPPPPHSEVFVRPVSQRSKVVSIIQPMTEDDEFDVDDVYEEGITPNKNDTPVPAVPPVPVVPERNPRRGNLPEIPQPSIPDEPLPEPPTTPFLGKETSDITDPDEDGELYEPLDEVVMEVRNTDKEKEKNSSISEDKTEVESDKDRKKREKDEKRKLDLEKKRVKDLKSKFKIDISELEPENTKGAGVIIQDAKGKGKDLTVKKNQRVIMICMEKKVPKGKWLVKLEDDEDVIGYVDSNNVEVDNTLIRSIMNGTYIKKSSFSSMPDEQEEYEAIEPEQDDVYSEAV